MIKDFIKLKTWPILVLLGILLGILSYYSPLVIIIILALVILIMIGIIPFSYKDPFTIFLLAVFFLPFRGIEILFFKISDILIIILFVKLLLDKYPFQKIKQSVQITTVIIFICYLILNTLFAAYILEGVLQIIRYLILFIFFICTIALIDTKKKLYKSISVFLASATISASIGILAAMGWFKGVTFSGFQNIFIKVWPFLHSDELRIMPFYTDPNHYASLLIIPLLILISYLVFDDGKKRKYLLMTAVIGAALILTMSRSGILAIILALLILPFFLRDKRKAALWLIILIIAVPIAALSADNINSLYVESMKNYRRGVSSHYDTRLDIWNAGINMIKDNSVLGVGLNNFQHRFNEYREIDARISYKQIFPHNIYLKVAAETGIIGFILFLLLLLLFLRISIRNLIMSKRFKTISVALFLSLIALLIQGFFLDLFTARHLWFIFGLIVVVSNLEGGAVVKKS